MASVTRSDLELFIPNGGDGVGRTFAGEKGAIDKTITPVKGGDITIARPGDTHALKNSGKEPLVFLDVIGQR